MRSRATRNRTKLVAARDGSSGPSSSGWAMPPGERMPVSSARPSARRRALAWSSARRATVPSGPSSERHQAGGRQHAHLAHPAAQELAGAAGAGDERRRADHHGADRRRQPLREAEGDRVGGRRQRGRCDAQRDGRVEEAGAVDVKGHAALVRDRGDAFQVRDRQWLAPGVRVRVLEHDQAGDGLVEVRRVAEGVLDLRRVQRPVGALAQGADRRADDDGVTARLVQDRVGHLAGDGLVAAGKVGHQRDEVAHGAARHEQAGLLAQERGGAGLELVDRGVVAEDVVADPGRGHRAAHGLGGVRDGVGAEIDDGGHGRASIARVARVGARLRAPCPRAGSGSPALEQDQEHGAASSTAPTAAQNRLPVMKLPAMNPRPWPSQMMPTRARTAARTSRVERIWSPWCRGRVPLGTAVRLHDAPGSPAERGPAERGPAERGPAWHARTSHRCAAGCVARMVTAPDRASEASGASSACARRKNGAHVGHNRAYDATRVERNPARPAARVAPASGRATVPVSRPTP